MKTWNIDKAHSEIGFKIKHLMISTLRGQFTTFDGSIKLPSENLTEAVISFTADVSSINTSNTMRDDHLKSADFFNVSEFPTLTFNSKNIEKVGENEYKILGELTMHGITKDIHINAIYNGMVNNMDGNSVMSFEMSGSLNRDDFGLTWNAPMEKGGLLVSNEVKLDINAEFTELK